MTIIGIDELLKLGLSTALGLIIGLEREIKRKPVGLKTSLVISIVSCLLTIVSIESAYTFPENDKINIQMDPLRLAAQIVSGIGFLGAGVILRRGSDNISGLTTAAMIWGAAGIGVAVGAGFYWEAIAGAVLLIISVEVLPNILGFFGLKHLKDREIRLQVKVIDKDRIDYVISSIKEKRISIKNIRIKDLEDGGHLVYLLIALNYKKEPTEIYHKVSKLDGIRSVEIETLY